MNDPAATQCAKKAPSCNAYLKSDVECLRSIDVSLRKIRRIAVYFLVLSILGLILGLAIAGSVR